MPRPRLISDEKIVAAAREVFFEQGFSATTAEIARRAGISEGTLFKRFATKEDIFEEVVGLRDNAAWREELAGLVGVGDVRRNLERAALHFIETAGQDAPQPITPCSNAWGTPSATTRTPWPPTCARRSRSGGCARWTPT